MTDEYVYVMSNRSYSFNVLKIGWTRKNPIIAATNLYTSGVPTPFNIEYIIITKEGIKLEKTIHDLLYSYRINPNRDFFKIDTDKLFEILTKELHLELIDVYSIPEPHSELKYSSEVNEIIVLFERLKNEANELFHMLRIEKSQIVIHNMNDVKVVSFIPNEYSTNALEWISVADTYEEEQFKNICNCIDKEIIQYNKIIKNLIKNYEEIKSVLSYKQLKNDNKQLLEMISTTHIKLMDLKNEYTYIWELDGI